MLIGQLKQGVGNGMSILVILKTLKYNWQQTTVCIIIFSFFLSNGQIVSVLHVMR